MDLDSIKNIFKAISELSDIDVQNYSDTIDDARDFIEKKLISLPESLEDLQRCEYAAACVAYYDYTILSIMKERRGMTITGSATQAFNNNERLEGARELRNNALLRISDLTQDMDFIFTSVRG